MSLRSLSRILRQFDNTINRIGRDMMLREGARFPSALAPVSRTLTPLTGAGAVPERDLWTPFADLESDLLPEWTGPGRTMPVDVIETDKEYQVNVDVPAGLTKDDVTVEKSRRDHTITVSCERSEEATTKDQYYCVKERAWGLMKRIINVPDNVDMDAINVKFDAGVLKMTLPKTEPSLPEKVILAIED